MISEFLTLVCESFSEGLFTEIRTMEEKQVWKENDLQF